MAHSIAAKYAARPAARFVRPSSRARERYLGLGAPSAFTPASPRMTELQGLGASPLVRLRAGWRGPRPARPITSRGRPRPLVRMQWARSERAGAAQRPGVATAPWHA